MASTSGYTKATVSFTLPISCQICLGKVKEPVICPNQHVFCTPCLDVWLRHNPLCPACRVPITPESPCKQIRGGPSPTEVKADKGLGRAFRRARVDIIFDEYENEIQRLEEQVKLLRSQMKKSDTASPSIKIRGEGERSSDSERSEVDREEVIRQLTVKLKRATSASQRVKAETEKLKEANSKLRDENVALSIETGRLKQNLAARSPRKYEKYAQAALQRKVDQCTKEIVQLKKALTRSDSYTEELESKIRLYQERYGDLEVAAEKNDCKNGDIISFGELPWMPSCTALLPKDILDGEEKTEDWDSGRRVTDGGDGEDCLQYPSCTSHGDPVRDERCDEGWSPVKRNMGAREDSEKFVSHSLRAADGASGSCMETARDNASPAKRRLLMYDEETDDTVGGNSNMQKPTINKLSDSNLNEDLRDISELTGDSSTLEQPSSSVLMTPSTSLSQLPLQESPEKLENSHTERQSKWRKPLSSNKGESRQFAGMRGNPPRQNRRSVSPRRVPRSLTFSAYDDDDDDDYETPQIDAKELEVSENSPHKCPGRGCPDDDLEILSGRSGMVEIVDSKRGWMDSPQNGECTHDNDLKMNYVDSLRRGSTVGSRRGRAGSSDAEMDQANHSRRPQTGSSRRQQGCLRDPREGAGRSHDETLNGTLSNLDYSLTPEFVDCTKLLRAAEDRLSSRQSAEERDITCGDDG